MVNGGSGVGKTTLAWALARKYNIVSVIGSDVLRETIRYYEEKMGTDKNDPIFYSSFEGGNGANDIPTKNNVITSFRDQSGDITEPLVRVINRVRQKRDPAIIEGVNIIASEVFKHIPHDVFSRIVLINLHLDAEDIHKQRLSDRGISSNEPPEETDRYIKNIAAIRKIDKFLKEDSSQYISIGSCVISFENSVSLSTAVDCVDKKIKLFIKMSKS